MFEFIFILQVLASSLGFGLFVCGILAITARRLTWPILVAVLFGCAAIVPAAMLLGHFVGSLYEIKKGEGTQAGLIGFGMAAAINGLFAFLHFPTTSDAYIKKNPNDFFITRRLLCCVAIPTAFAMAFAAVGWMIPMSDGLKNLTLCLFPMLFAILGFVVGMVLENQDRKLRMQQVVQE